jgi:hypothetical protein
MLNAGNETQQIKRGGLEHVLYNEPFIGSAFQVSVCVLRIDIFGRIRKVFVVLKAKMFLLWLKLKSNER